MKFKRGFYNLFYKKKYQDIGWRELHFIKKKTLKLGFVDPPSRTNETGVDENRQNEILKNLAHLMPQKSRMWWENVPTKHV
jgi:hypothetical protein